MAFGGTLQSMLFQLEVLGFFDFVLPFLLAFAVIYGILTYTKIFGNQKAIHVIVAIILGLLSIRLPFFSAFLTEMTPRLGVGLVILLSIVILIGLFVPKSYEDIIGWVLLAVGAVIFIVILLQSSNVLGYFGYGPGFFSGEIIGWIVMVAVLVGIIIAVAVGGSDKHSSSTDPTRHRGNQGLGPMWGGDGGKPPTG